jgi:UDP-4-amino-4,6-dideoxy-N-acetyl-beta-L-altrosamine transaminase
MIPYNRHHVDQDDIDEVISVLKSDYLTQGNKVNEFEQALINTCKSKYAVAVSSGTAALHLACLALGVKPGDSVWTSPISFVATANCILYCGANVEFIDIDILSGCMSADALKNKLEKTDSIPKVVIVVNYAGHSADMESISKLSKQYGFYIVEDCCHALGGTYKGVPIGSCQYSDISIFSFHPIKTITTGEGGALSTNNKDFCEVVKKLRSHGIDRGKSEYNPYAWSYDQVELGYNYRMSDVNAAIGISQLKKLDKFMEKRSYIADVYNKRLPDFIHHVSSNDSNSANHLYSILIPDAVSEKCSNEFFNFMKDGGIIVQKNYRPIYRNRYFSAMKSFEYLKNSEEFYLSQASLPIFYDLEYDSVVYVIDRIRKYFGA